MNYEQYEKYVNEFAQVREENNRRISEKFAECEKYVADNLLDCGCVFTKHDKMLKSQKFMIWIDRGNSISHKFLTLSECNIPPLILLPYPQRK